MHDDALHDEPAVYARTPAGQRELIGAATATAWSREALRLLALANGYTPADEIAALMRCGDTAFEAHARALLEGGLIVLVEPLPVPEVAFLPQAPGRGRPAA